MPLYALDLDDAFDATKAFLWPLDRSRWIKLAVVVFFVGGPGATRNTFQYNVPVEQGAPPAGVSSPAELGPCVGALVLAVAAVALLVGLSVLAVAALAQVPVVTYLRHSALLVLGDVDEGLDVIPERRGAVRAEDVAWTDGDAEAG